MAGGASKSNASEAARLAQAESPLTGPGAVATCSKTPTTRAVNGVVMKRKHIDPFGEDKYGHWWFEIDGTESYGWWPKNRIGPKETFGGVDGELNGRTTFGGAPTLDPHHGDDAEETFTAVTSLSDTRTDAQIKDCLRRFARSYAGEWRWTFGAGQNCHSFQEAAMQHCGLSKP